MKSNKKYIIIIIYVFVNLIIFSTSFFHTFNLIRSKGLDVGKEFIIFQAMRSLAYVIIFNFFIYFLIKIKIINTSKYFK